MASTTTLKGNIVIGSTNPITIPVQTTMPPSVKDQIVFNYQLEAGSDPTTVVSVGEFLTWAQNMLSIPNFEADLPASLTSLFIGVDKLTIDTTGKFDINVLFGTMVKNKWLSSWKPISALPFSFTDLELDVAYST
ncbi:hypothetical protein ACO0LM_00770 [Undibacterium sp. Di26W]|uniref:hypothetical protein n=1 Tax=Undibacterium sp. Di26W TaxID=3413035 RepID=UPI003BF15D2B